MSGHNAPENVLVRRISLVVSDVDGTLVTRS